MDAEWIRMPGNWLDVAPFGHNNFVAVDMEGHVFVRVAGELRRVEGALCAIVSTGDGKRWWGYGADSMLFTCDGDGKWKSCNITMHVRSLALHETECGTSLFVLTTEGHLWKHTPATGHWVHMTPEGTLVNTTRLVFCVDYIDTLKLGYVTGDRRVWCCDPTWYEGITLRWSSPPMEAEDACVVTEYKQHVTWAEREPVNKVPRKTYIVTASHRVRCAEPCAPAQLCSTYVAGAPRARLVRAYADIVFCIDDVGTMFWHPGPPKYAR